MYGAKFSRTDYKSVITSIMYTISIEEIFHGKEQEKNSRKKFTTLLVKMAKDVVNNDGNGVKAK